MKVYRIRSHEENRAHMKRMEADYAIHRQFEQAITPERKKTFYLKGYSYPAGRTVKFLADFSYSDGKNVNWRERLVCPVTKLNNRIRASLHVLDLECMPYRDDSFYLTEQVTPFFHYMKERYPQIHGSEFLGDSVPLGEKNQEGIRNEDLTQLSLPDASVDKVISFDCFEHVPGYRKAFRECARITKPGGKMLWSVPFDRNSADNIVRARVLDDGSVEHLLEPEYHGDPINDDGCLCYYHFGWQMLDEVREAGFRDAYAALYWSSEFGYLGGEQVLFVATR